VWLTAIPGIFFTAEMSIRIHYNLTGCIGLVDSLAAPWFGGRGIPESFTPSHCYYKNPSFSYMGLTHSEGNAFP